MINSRPEGPGSSPSANPPSSAVPGQIPARSSWLFRHFRNYSRRYVSKHFHAIRLSVEGFRPDARLGGPIIVVLNHPSWWDPLIGLVLSEAWPETTRHFAPIDSAGLAKYPVLERLGFFGIEPNSPQGARTLLRRGLAILDDSRHVLWVTPQGRFVDPRARPTRFKPGIGYLVHRVGRGVVLPLALEYAFWQERTPEVLARFGTPIELGGSRETSPRDWTTRLERALETVQVELARDAMSRDPSRFETKLEGRAGIGGIYDFWRRTRAALRGRRFAAEHGERTEP
ncbi:lysophospholipid acyltransferase family protein [Singulisphaera rosea]